jgi:hypothetical protein
VAVFSQTIRVAAATGGRGDVDMRCVEATLNVRSMGPKAEAAIQVCVGLPRCLNGARGLVRGGKKARTKSGTATADDASRSSKSNARFLALYDHVAAAPKSSRCGARIIRLAARDGNQAANQVQCRLSP